MLLHEVVETSAAVAATRSRKAKVTALAACLRRAAPDELETVTAYLGGALRQRRTGIGWRGAGASAEPADEPSLTVTEVHEAFDLIAALGGTGSQATRKAAVAALFGRATATEQVWLRGALTGAVRQGALDALVQEAVASAAEVPLPAVRRAAMLAGGTVPIVATAFAGGAEALATVGLEVGRPVLPMLASSAPDLGAAMVKAGGGPVAVDVKLDGIRIQVHRDGDDVLVATRSLDDITERLPEVVELVRALPARRLVLDGEALALDDAGRPRPFQETASRTAQDSGVTVTPYFFDLLHLDGDDLLDSPGAERLARLAALVPEAQLVPRLVTDDPAAAEEFAQRVLADGHEGVVVKNLDAPYDAGRRGSAWVKVKPVHTLDLVVLAVEWGSGRRAGLALQHPPRRPRPRLRRLRDARQDLQGDDRRDARVADRALHRAGHLAHRPVGVRRAGRAGAGRRDRLRRRPAVQPLPRWRGPALRTGGALPRRQDRRRGRHDRDGAGISVGLPGRSASEGRVA